MTHLPETLLTELRATLAQKGYYKRRYGYYFLLSACLVVGFAISIYTIAITDSLWIQCLNAAFFGFIVIQAGMLGHDLSHGQVFSNIRLNRTLAMLLWGFVAGLSESKWYLNHSQHHNEVNHSEHDPDLQMPFIFQDEQVEFKNNRYQSLRRYQHILFFVVLPLAYPIYIMRSIVHDISDLNRTSIIELTLMALHYLVFLGLIFYNLPLLTGLVFVFIFAAVSGTYMGLVFAPNHKGMPMVDESASVEWWHQIVCTRNLYPNVFTFHLMGGLNYQIEHHLFPHMPRINYQSVAPMVKEFCKQYELEYYESSWTGSMREIYISLKKMSLAVPKA